MRPGEKKRRKRARRRLRQARKLEHLNDDVLLHIFAYLPTAPLTAVCKRWRQLLWDTRGADVFCDLNCQLWELPPPKVYRVYLTTSVVCGCGMYRTSAAQLRRALHLFRHAAFIVCVRPTEVYTGCVHHDENPLGVQWFHGGVKWLPLPEKFQEVKGNGLIAMTHYEWQGGDRWWVGFMK